MTTTILGANGKLGVNLSRYARLNGLNWQRQARSGAADVIWSGRFDDPAVDQIFQPGATLINMIGYTGADEAQLYQTNVKFVQDLLAKAAQAGVAHVILASSAATYGVGSGTPCEEDARLHPQTPYGASKVAMEQIATASYALHESPAITIARIGNVAGADALTFAAQRHLADGAPMPLHRFDDGSAPQRSYIGPRDLFTAINALTEPHHDKPRIVNVTHPQPVALDDLLTAYRTHLMPDLKWRDMAAPDTTPREVILSTEQAQNFVKLETYDNHADALARQVAELQRL